MIVTDNLFDRRANDFPSMIVRTITVTETRRPCNPDISPARNFVDGLIQPRHEMPFVRILSIAVEGGRGSGDRSSSIASIPINRVSTHRRSVPSVPRRPRFVNSNVSIASGCIERSWSNDGTSFRVLLREEWENDNNWLVQSAAWKSASVTYGTKSTGEIVESINHRESPSSPRLINLNAKTNKVIKLTNL